MITTNSLSLKSGRGRGHYRPQNAPQTARCEAAKPRLKLPRFRNALFVLFIGLASACVRHPPDPTATWTPAAKTVGLFLNEPEAFGGYTLFNKAWSETIYLIDNQGRVVHRWELDSRPLFTKLLKNGNLLTLVNTDPLVNTDQGLYVREVDRNGNILSTVLRGVRIMTSLKCQRECAAAVRQSKTPEEVIAAGANPEFIGPDGLFAPHIVKSELPGRQAAKLSGNGRRGII